MRLIKSVKTFLKLFFRTVLLMMTVVVQYNSNT